MFEIGWNKILLLPKVKNAVPWANIISDFKEEEIVGTFYRKEFKKNQKTFRVEIIINRKYDELCAKWKGYNSSFNSWIDKKDPV